MQRAKVRILSQVRFMWQKRVVYITAALWPITLFNFFVFMGVSLYLGGDGLNGKKMAGHYYVADHGQYTEVSYAVFLYSRIHALFTLGTFVVLLGLMLLLELKGKHDFPHNR